MPSMLDRLKFIVKDAETTVPVVWIRSGKYAQALLAFRIAKRDHFEVSFFYKRRQSYCIVKEYPNRIHVRDASFSRESMHQVS